MGDGSGWQDRVLGNAIRGPVEGVRGRGVVYVAMVWGRNGVTGILGFFSGSCLLFDLGQAISL